MTNISQLSFPPDLISYNHKKYTIYQSKLMDIIIKIDRYKSLLRQIGHYNIKEE